VTKKIGVTSLRRFVVVVASGSLSRIIKIDATMVLVGAVEPLKAIPWWKHYYGTQAHCWFINWGIKETQEMLDFCRHNITSDIELIDMQDINSI
jgi:uncharacterized zinc-type alcohol dehydrogenase-like protein